MHSVTFGENLKNIIKTNTSYQKHARGGVVIVGLFCSHRTWGPHSHWAYCELLPKYDRVKLEAIHLTAKAWPKFGDATGQWSQAHQQIYSRTTEKEKNQGVTKPQSKSRPHPDWEMCVNKCPQTWSNVEKKGGPKLNTDNVIQKMITSSYCC